MTRHDGIIDIFLHPGEFHFGDAEVRLRTILGSCVAVTMWHPKLRIGGMTHSLLPGVSRRIPREQLEGKYVEDAITFLVLEAARHGTRLKEYEFKLFGGSDMFRTASSVKAQTIGLQNLTRAVRLLEALDLEFAAHDVGGTVSRSLSFELASGDVWLRRGIRRLEMPDPLELDL